jgi:hypothetical protein
MAKQDSVAETTPTEAPDVQENPLLALYFSREDERRDELKDALSFLVNSKGLRLYKGIQYDRAIEYFRGVQFIVLVIKHNKEVLSRLPSFTQDKLLTELESVQDANKLGQYMLYQQLISKGESHPNLKEKPGAKLHKYPKFLSHTIPIFGHDGQYILENKLDKKQ